MTEEPDWRTPDIVAAQAGIDESVQAVHELVDRVEREGMPAGEETPEPPAKKPEPEENIVLRHDSW